MGLVSKPNLIQQPKMIAVLALFCFAPAVLGQYYNVPYAYQYQPAYAAPAYAAPAYAVPAYAYAAPAPVMRPEDAAAVNELGAEGIATGKKALNIASNLAKNVFPAAGPIINGA